MKKPTRHTDQLTNRIIPNGPAQMRTTRHQDDDQATLPHTNTVVRSSSLPTVPGSSTPTGHIDQPTNRIILNGPAQTRARHQGDDQATLPYTSTLVRSSSLPTRPGSSAPMDSHSKRSLKSRVRSTNERCSVERRCTSFAQLPRNNC